MPIFTFPPRHPVASARLPLTLISLEEWALATIKGPDSTDFLQGQLTIDVTALPDSQHLPCAHCDAKGKIWSSLRLFHHAGGYAALERRSLRDRQLSELKKYAVFADVTLAAADECVLSGVAGFQARSALASLYPSLPDAETPVVHQGETSLLWFAQPAERFLLVTSSHQAQVIQNTLTEAAQLNNSAQWMALDIEAGLPIIDDKTSAQFIPQAVNLQALEGICFNKGCYSGQEMVARARFRGANKRALYWLSGRGSQLPQAGEALELRLGENWRRTGSILAAVQLDNGELWVQAVLTNDLDAASQLRLRSDENSSLTVHPLPYSVS